MSKTDTRKTLPEQAIDYFTRKPPAKPAAWPTRSVIRRPRR